MKEEIITTFEKFVSKEKDVINEMSIINNITKDCHIMPSSYKVEVRSNDHTPPHFHYINKDGMDIKVDILTLDVIDSEPRIGVSDKELKSWTGLSNEKKILFKWLKNKNAALKVVTNYKMVAATWNIYHIKYPVDIDELKKI